MAQISARNRSFRQHLLARLSDRFRHHVESCTDLRGVTTDPLHAAYLNPEGAFVLDVPGRACRGLHAAAYPLTPDSDHPFIATLRAMAAGLPGYDGSPLQAYYARFRPKSAAEVLGIPPDSAHRDLRGDPHGCTFPWDFRTPDQAMAFWAMVCARDYRQHGFDLTLSDGWKGWGPVTDAAGRAEFLRLSRACQSIATQGYLRHSADDGDIQGILLQNGHETRILVTAGQHRAAILAALGHADLPVRLSPAVVNRADVTHWPNVRRGLFLPAQACQIFDRIFAGRQPFGQAANPPMHAAVNAMARTRS